MPSALGLCRLPVSCVNRGDTSAYIAPLDCVDCLFSCVSSREYVGTKDRLDHMHSHADWLIEST